MDFNKPPPGTNLVKLKSDETELYVIGKNFSFFSSTKKNRHRTKREMVLVINMEIFFLLFCAK